MADLDKLERTSLTALFYSVLGNREEQVEKEREELLNAQLQYQKTKFMEKSIMPARRFTKSKLK